MSSFKDGLRRSGQSVLDARAQRPICKVHYFVRGW